MLNDADLTYMRDTVAELLPATCHVLSLTRTGDGQGGWTETWGTAVQNQNKACRLDYQQGVGQRNEAVFGNALQPYTGFVLSLPHGTAVTAANRIKIGSTEYNITAVDNGKSWSAVVRCALEAV